MIQLNLDVITHKASWSPSGDHAFTEQLFILRDGSASFVLYWYDDKPDSLVLRNLFVSTEFRRRGVALKILSSLTDYCKLNKKELHFWVEKDSWIERWYRSIGFAPNGEMDGDNIWMGYLWS